MAFHQVGTRAGGPLQHAKPKFRGRPMPALALAVALAAGAWACGKDSSSPTNPNPNPTPPPGTPSLRLRLVESGLDYPTFLTGAPGDTSRLFVLEKGGTIRVIKSGILLPTPFLSVAVSGGGELGLLGMAFDPG